MGSSTRFKISFDVILREPENSNRTFRQVKKQKQNKKNLKWFSELSVHHLQKTACCVCFNWRFLGPAPELSKWKALGDDVAVTQTKVWEQYEDIIPIHASLKIVQDNAVIKLIR